MKFLCLDCDAQMTFRERREPGDGTFAAAFGCPACGRAVALLANPMETQLVGALGVRIGGAELDRPAAPMEHTRAAVAVWMSRSVVLKASSSPASPLMWARTLNSIWE